MLTTSDIAQQCGVSQSQVQWWIKRDRLRATRVPGPSSAGYVFMVKEEDFETWLSTIGVLMGAKRK